MKTIKQYLHKRKVRKLKYKSKFQKIIKRFDTPRHIRKDVEQGEKVKFIHEDKTYLFMYLYSHLDEDFFLRLNDNIIVVYPSIKFNVLSEKDIQH